MPSKTSGKGYRRPLTIAASTVSCVLLVAACGSTGNSAGSPGNGGGSGHVGSNPSGTVTFWTRNTTGSETLLKGFSSKYPNVHVKITPEPANGTATEKLGLAIRANSQPDLVDLNDIYTPLLAKDGELVNLDNLYHTLPYAKSLNAGQVDLGKWDGQYYAVPYLADLSMLFYNKTLLAKAGITSPPSTWPAIVHDAQAVVKAVPSDYGFSFPGNSSDYLGFLTIPSIGKSANGNTSLFSGSVSAQKANLSTNSALRTLMTDYRTMWTTPHVVPPADQTQSGSTFNARFEHGLVAIEPADFGLSDTLKKDKVKFKWGLMGLPGISGAPSTFDGGETLVIPKKSGRSPALAELVLEWLLSKQAQLRVPTFGETPVRTDLLNASYKQQHPYDSVALRTLENGVVPDSLAYDALFNVSSAPYGAMWYKAIFGKPSNSVATALQEGQGGFSSALAQNG